MKSYLLTAAGCLLLACSTAAAGISEIKHNEITSAPVLSVAFSPDGRTALSGGEDGTLNLWDMVSGDPLRTFEGHWGKVWSAAFSPDGRTVLSGSEDGTLNLWDVASGDPLRTFKGHSGDVYFVAFSPDGRTALSGSGDDTMKLWDIAEGRLLRIFKGHSGDVTSVSFSPDGRTALSGSKDKTLKSWNIATGKVLRTFKGHSNWILSAAISPDGRTALSGSDTLKLWDVASGRLLRTFDGSSDAVMSVAFSPDGRTALSGSHDKTLKLWDVASGRLLRTFEGHSRTVEAVAFSPAGRTALSGSGDASLRLWDIATGQVLGTFEARSDAAPAATSTDPAPDKAVTSFTWTYDFQPEPGKRTWTRNADGSWNEQYPSGRVAKVFDVSARGTVDQCAGAIVSPSGERNFEVFIPDVGCKPMVAKFRHGSGAWNNMGAMDTINSVAAPADDVSVFNAAGAQSTLALALLGARQGQGAVSPAGIAAVLGALDLGADPAMHAAIAGTLGLRNKQQMEELRRALRLLAAGPANDTLSGANVLFLDLKQQLKPGAADLLLAEAQMPVRPVDLSSAAGIREVNAFVADKTKGRIPSILGENDTGASLAAVNAFHFLGRWQVPFDPKDTRPAPFALLDGKAVEVPTMSLGETALAHKLDGRFAAVELAYDNPRYALVLVTTTDKPATAAEFAPARGLLDGTGFARTPIALELPRFKIEAGADLLPTLSGLGLAAGLRSPTALSGLADGIVLAAVRQKTFIAVDEQGTEAAAATAAVTTRSLAGRPTPIVFDKPFVFALRDKPTGLVLLAGYVGDPSK